jgi:purine-binding chemotaxis protein CheW
MARRAERVSQSSANAASAESANGADARGEAAGAHFVVFQLSGNMFGFRLDDVDEIVRMPRLAPMPLAPRSLHGLANLHGMVLPVVGLRTLLGLPEAPLNEATRVIVTDRGAPVGFVVDRIENLLAVSADRVEQDEGGAGSVDPSLLSGIIKGAEGESTIKIFDPLRLLREEFSQLGVSRSGAAAAVSVSAAISTPAIAAPEQKLSLVSFHLGKQEYALPLDRVREIIQLPEQVSQVARSETAVLGVVTLRDRLLPLISLRTLLGLPADGARDESSKVVVLSMGQGVIGVVADRTREILHVDPGVIDPAPALLTRGEGDAEITSICRLDHGKRLVAVLSPDHLFRSDLVRRVLSEHGNWSDDSAPQTDGSVMADEQFIIFRLGNQEFGMPIAAVDEIARPPEQIAHLPKAPAFVEGVMNLRGIVVPLVDLRQRFEITSEEPASSRRILVLEFGGGKTGFMVDGVSEVMKIPTNAIRPAPEVSQEQMRLISRVANLDAQNRMILLIDPTQLLNRIEADVLVKFDRTNPEQASKPS